MSDCHQNAKVTITPIEPCPECESAELPSYAITVNELTAIRARVTRLEAAARELDAAITGFHLSGHHDMNALAKHPARQRLREALQDKPQIGPVTSSVTWLSATPST